MKTTVGNLLINEILPEEHRDYSRVITGGNFNQIMNGIAKRQPHEYAETAKKLKDLGDTYATQLGSSINFEDFKPKDLSHIHNKFEKQYAEARKISNLKLRDNKFKEINKQYEDAVNEEVAKDLKTPNKFTSWIASGAKGGKDDLRQLNYSIGNMVDITNQVFPHVAKTSLSYGLTPSDYFITSLGARNGVVKSFISVRDPGAFGKEIFTLTNDLTTTMHDCGTLDGKMYHIDNPHALDRFLLKDVGVHKRNDLVDHHVIDDLRRSGINDIWVRTPIYCKAQHGICSMCAGLLENGKISPIGDSIGVRSAQSIAEPLTQLALKSKHTGGVVGQKSAFEQLKQILHVPENFPGGAVLAKHNGIIDEIETTPDGGRRLYINNHPHYIKPNVGILMKKGDEVKKGDVLSEGIINPAELVDLKGIEVGREHLSNAMRNIYEQNGIKGHPSVFETISRAVINHAQVTDPGDYLDHNIGEEIRYEQNKHKFKRVDTELPLEESIGFRSSITHPGLITEGTMITPDHVEKMHKHLKTIKAYKEPMKIKPFMKGTERAAMIKDDWLAEMGYRFVKQNLIDNVAQMKDTKLHNPISAYVAGEIGRRKKNEFGSTSA